LDLDELGMTTMRRDCEQLTAAQARVFNFLYYFARDNAFQPSTEEIAEAFGWTSHNAAKAHLRRLDAKGWIALKRGKRAVTILRRPDGTKFDGFADKKR
jgi:SOS-response transcriptional repressor LexA